MSTPSPPHIDELIDYPTEDEQPSCKSDIHRENMADTLWTLQRWFAKSDDICVSGSMFIYYVPGDRKRRLCPDVFVVHGVPRTARDCYKTWEEPKPSLDLVIEFTSRSTKDEDLDDKFDLYRDRLGVHEYLLFDPYSEYLDPPQQLFRRSDAGEFEQVKPVDGRLPSEVLGLHFERDDRRLRLWIPETGEWVLTPKETDAAMWQEREALRREQEAHREEQQAHREEQQAHREEQEAHREEQEAHRKEQEENERLRAELADLKRRIADADKNGGESTA